MRCNNKRRRCTRRSNHDHCTSHGDMHRYYYGNEDYDDDDVEDYVYLSIRVSWTDRLTARWEGRGHWIQLPILRLVGAIISPIWHTRRIFSNKSRYCKSITRRIWLFPHYITIDRCDKFFFSVHYLICGSNPTAVVMQSQSQSPSLLLLLRHWRAPPLNIDPNIDESMEANRKSTYRIVSQTWLCHKAKL